MRGSFYNTGTLVRFMLGREKVISTVWIIILTLFSASLAPSLSGMFDAAGRAQFVATLDNPVMVAMMGPVYGAENYTAGAMYTGMMLLWVLITVAVMNIFLVSRHTRADEEKGRAEVVRSLPVGRLAGLNAAMVTAVIVNAALGLAVGLGLAAMRVEGMGLAGSMLYGAVTCAAGLVFAAVTALFCQLSASKGGATGYSFLTLGVFYMLRAAGDMQGNELLSCLSPLGLALRAQAFIENHWWPVAVLLLIFVAITAAAYKLNAMRDLDQGLLHARPGKKEASQFMRSPFGFALRLSRKTILLWILLMLVLGASYASVIGDISTFVGGSPQYLEILGMPAEIVAGLSDITKNEMIQKYFMAFVTTMMTLVAVVPLLIVAMKPRSEEKEHRAEHILTRSTPRIKYLAGYAALAFAVSVLLQLATAIGIYGTAASLVGEANPFTLELLLRAYLAYLPALWVMISVAVLLTGLLPKASGAVWGYFGFVCVASFLGEFIGLPAWLLKLAPLKNVSQVLLVDLNWTPLIVMTAIALVFTAVGLICYRRRDLLSG